MSYNDYKILFEKLKFYYDSNINVLCNIITSKTFEALDKKIINCYLKNKDFICLYAGRNYKYKIIILNTDLDFLKDEEFSINVPSSLITFFKFLHFKNDLWSFIYYQGIEEDYPIMQFIEIKKDQTNYYISLKYSIKLNYYSFNNTKLLTDFAKIRDNLLCVTATKKSKEVLIIILINFFNEMEYNIRYYLIDIFSLYNHKLFKELKINNYNNNLALAFSFCPQSICDSDDNEHYTSLIFFSYPNTIDHNFDLINYLNKEENNNITISLFDHIIIDNNIFGFIIDGIKIYSIDVRDIDFISNITNEKIKDNDTLKQNENIELILKEDEYEISNYSISYSLIITEPDYDEYNKYPNYTLKDNNEKEKYNFTKNLYEGKIGFFNIFINKDITKDCRNENINCLLCSKRDKFNCYLCKNEYDFVGNKKICKNYFSTTIETTFIEENFELSEFQQVGTNLIINGCNIVDLIKAKCQNLTITNEEYKEIYNYIKNKIIIN